MRGADDKSTGNWKGEFAEMNYGSLGINHKRLVTVVISSPASSEEQSITGQKENQTLKKFKMLMSETHEPFVRRSFFVFFTKKFENNII